MSSLDFFRNLQPLFEAAEVKDEKKKGFFQNKDKPAKDQLEDPPEEVKLEDKKASNVKETAGAFFRRYSDIIAEAEEVDEEELAPPPKEVKIPKDLTKKGFGKQGK